MSEAVAAAGVVDVRGLTQEPAISSAPEESPSYLEEGIALCLSGGGYRAMLFHVGAILRLNELAILTKVKRVSSVSGGSITAAVLGMNWDSFKRNGDQFTAASLQADFVGPIRKMAATSIDVSSVVWGALSPWSSINEEVISAYDSVLFQGKTLQHLPDDRDGLSPRFVITATNVKTGSLWRFSRPYMADYRVGRVEVPEVLLSHAVAASSAFPPFLSPMRLSLNGLNFIPNEPKGQTEESLRSLRGEAVLTDGGVYDNLGLEAVWKRYKTILVSDGGRKMEDDFSPASDWARHSRRLIDLLQHQVSSLRRRMTIGAFLDPVEPHDGTYWGIQTNISDYQMQQTLSCPHSDTLKIAGIETRLTALSDRDQERLINWGYAVCDAATRKYVPDYQIAPAPADFPYANVGVSP